jgi:hypothetical protein
MLSKLHDFLAPRAKAIAALLAPYAVAAVAHYGFHVDVNVAETVITSIIASIGVHQVTNKGN